MFIDCVKTISTQKILVASMYAELHVLSETLQGNVIIGIEQLENKGRSESITDKDRKRKTYYLLGIGTWMSAYERIETLEI